MPTYSSDTHKVLFTGLIRKLFSIQLEDTFEQEFPLMLLTYTAYSAINEAKEALQKAQNVTSPVAWNRAYTAAMKADDAVASLLECKINAMARSHYTRCVSLLMFFALYQAISYTGWINNTPLNCLFIFCAISAASGSNTQLIAMLKEILVEPYWCNTVVAEAKRFEIRADFAALINQAAPAAPLNGYNISRALLKSPIYALTNHTDELQIASSRPVYCRYPTMQ